MSIMDGNLESGNHGEPTPPSQTTQEPTHTENTPDTTTFSIDALPDDLKGDKALENFKGKTGNDLLTDLTKSYLGAQRLVGKGIRVPGEHSSEEDRAKFYEQLSNVEGVVKLPTTDEERAEFFTKLGKPTEATGYSAEGIDGLDKTAVDAAREFAHSLNLTQTQFEQLMKFEAERGEKGSQQVEQNRSEAKAQRDQILREEWTDYDDRIKGAELTVKQLGVKYGNAFVENLVETGAVYNPIVVAALSNMASSLTDEASLFDHKVEYGKTVPEIRDEISQIRTNPDYFKPGEVSKGLRSRVIELERMLAKS